MIEAEWWEYDSVDEMADAVAGDIGFIVESALDARGSALLALPGGKTPLPIFERLAAASLPWKNVTIIPTDERLVPLDSPLSNIRAIAGTFLKVGARVFPIGTEIADYRLAGNSADARLQDLKFPPDLVWLGMGEDGHTASIFPGPDLQDALDAPKARRAVGVMPDPLPPEAPVPRVTLTRAAILVGPDDPHHDQRRRQARGARTGHRPTGKARKCRSAACWPKPSSRSIFTGAPEMSLDPRIASVTDRIIERSRASRRRYLDLMAAEAERGISRPRLSCGNFAHGFAASGDDKPAIRSLAEPNIAIVTAYNDMLSAHQPYGRYPEAIKIYAREVGATAQVAGGVAAMCDGVTQGQPGMDLSLFSRDTIALSTAVALSHGMFEGVALLGICDKIVPGLLIGALRFGHLPALLIPGGPMPSGLANKEKQRVRQLFAEGKVGKEELLAAEAASYHGAGTCTFYGTANSNQMMMELMGLHIPGAAFINPGTPLRSALTRAAIHRLAGLAKERARPLGRSGRRARDRQCRGRAAGDRRIDQPCDPYPRHRPGGGHHLRLAGSGRIVGGGAADRAHLSQRVGRRERLPPCRRDGIRRAHLARSGAAA